MFAETGTATPVVNRGGRGRKSENPTYCTDDTEMEKADELRKIEGSARLLAAMMRHFERLGASWGVAPGVAVRIVDGMQRAGLEDYLSGSVEAGCVGAIASKS